MSYNFTDFLKKKNEKNLNEMTNQEIYYKLLEYVKERADEKTPNKSKKKIYYISAEFLIGKLLSNNLINLGIYKEVREELKAAGKNLSHIEEIEVEPSLGNGGLGRLASCFVDSMSTLGINGEGVGLNYHCGLFKQVFKNNEQKAEANYWIEDQSWLRDTNIGYEVKFKNFSLHSKLKRIDILGYEKDTKNYLNLFDIESIDYNLIKNGISFDEENIEKNLTLFLYPDDSTKKGELLRIYQQYFMVSNAARLIIAEATEKGSNIHDLADYAFVQINDTHPNMVIPELIRIMTEEHNISFEEATEIVTKMTGYTNHTILAEALEKWPLDYLEEVVPNIVEIIKKLEVAKSEMWKFYSQDFVNYRGKTSDKERYYYTEIIAKWLLDNIELFNDIKMISRENSYKVDSHDGKIKNEKSGREEEIIAMKLFDFSQNQGKVFDIIGKIIDYQTPLKNVQTDKAGKIDLLAYNENEKTLRILELKKPDSKETMLRCVLEAYTYLKVVDKAKLLKDFAVFLIYLL